MTRARPSWELLNAYVDGELDVAQAADVARAAADDTELARQVALLHSLKSTVSQSVDAPERPPAPVRPAPPSRRSAWAAMAAGIAIAGLVIVGLFVLDRQTTDDTGWLAEAIAVHRQLSARQDLAEPAAGVLLAAMAHVGHQAHVPDLSAAKLQIGGISEVALPTAGAALAVLYRGTRGCRLTLMIMAGPPGLAQELRRDTAAGADAYIWRAGSLGYVFMAEGMDPRRFALIAESVHRASIERAQFDKATRTALRRGRAESRPCRT